MSIRTYLKNKKQTHFTVGDIEVFIKDEVENEQVSVKSVINLVVRKIPKHLLRNIDSIYVGQFSFLNSKNFEAAYENSSIFVTNVQDNEADMLDDIVHEVAHSIEEIYSRYLYSDQKLATEFKRKRNKLHQILTDKDYDIGKQVFMNLDYDQELDEFLYSTVGYQALTTLSPNVFHSPYASTSLSEYFADGFEAFYMNDDIPKLKRISPELYKKLAGLIEEEE